jgi:putative oxidoreductase
MTAVVVSTPKLSKESSMNLERVLHSTGDEISVQAAKAKSGLGLALRRLVTTTDAIWPLVLRVTLGGVILPHALQKTLGSFGGFGLSKTIQWFTLQLHLPVPLAALVIFLEQTCSLALVLGLFTRAAAVAIGAVMVGAVWTVHLRYGFFMNWSGTQAGEGFEFHLLALAIVVALIVGGGGRGSLDRVLSRRKRDAVMPAPRLESGGERTWRQRALERPRSPTTRANLRV